MKTLTDKIFSFRNQGLAGRIAIAFIGVAIALSVLYGIGASAIIYYLLKENEAISTKRQVEIATQKTETALITLLSTVESLSANSIFVNGLVDAYGRDNYLVPFLKSSHLPIDIAHSLSLCNFKGDIIASNETSTGSYAGETALVKELVTSAKPVVSLMENGTKILICYPVIYPAVGTAEGFLALAFPLKDLMAKLEISKDASINGFQLFSETKQIWQIGVAEGTEHTRQLVFSNQLVPLKLSLQVWTPGNPVLLWFAVIFIFIMLLSLYISVKMAFLVSRKLTSGLVALDKAAADMAVSGTPQGEVDSTGTDEIARLGASFNSMIRRLKDSYQRLESQVAERTSQLKEANRELELDNALRRELVEQLEKSNARYRALFSRAVDGIFVMSIEGSLIEVNESFARMHGYTKEEMQSMSLPDLDTPETNQLARERISRVLAGEAQTFEVEHYHKNGHVFPLEVSASLISSGEKSTIQCFHRDITARRRAEAQTCELLLTLESVPNGILVHDADGNFLYANQRVCDMHGYSRDEFIALNLRQITEPASAILIDARVQEMSARGEISFEAEHIKKDGTILPLWVNVKTATWGGKSVSLSVEIDITERKQAEDERRRLEERLQRAEKMEALGQLAGGVAHDLNNVLGILSGYSELLLMDIPEGSRARGHVEKILQSTEKGATIIQDLLTLARRGVTVSDVINLDSIISDFIAAPAFAKIKDYQPRVIFRVECEPNLLNIKGSPVHLEKTLLNLVSNAAEAISGEGEVTIRTENRYLDKPLRGYDEVRQGDYVVLTVSDTGMGIPVENREKIFEPFYTKKAMGRSGTGLGLAIVWGTTKDHNGYIDVQTEVGMGTTFTLYFPVTREELTAPQQKGVIEQYTGKGESVLVVDDIAEQRDVASSLLTRLRYDVHTVSSGEEAVEYLKKDKADILVIDMIMAPGIDGLETYQKILEINPNQKAILVSGFSETDRVKKTLKLGAGAYVKKPYVLQKIGVAIRDELARK